MWETFLYLSSNVNFPAENTSFYTYFLFFEMKKKNIRIISIKKPPLAAVAAPFWRGGFFIHCFKSRYRKTPQKFSRAARAKNS